MSFFSFLSFFILLNAIRNYLWIKRCSVFRKKFFNTLSYFFRNITGIKGCYVLPHAPFGQETVKIIKQLSKEETSIKEVISL